MVPANLWIVFYVATTYNQLYVTPFKAVEISLSKTCQYNHVDPKYFNI